MKYIELQPFRRDTRLEAESVRRGEKRPAIDFYLKAEPIIVRLDSIRSIRVELSTAGTPDLYRIAVSGDRDDDIIVMSAEGEKLKKILLEDHESDLAKAISYLTKAIRDLWELLRARLR